MKAIKYEKDAVLIKDGSIKAWVDVVVDDGEIYYDWNKYIFFLNRERDRALSNWQDKTINFENATNLAIETLVNFNILFLDDKNRWHYSEKYFTTNGTTII